MSPDSDIVAVELACALADDLVIARDRFRATSDPRDGRMVATFSASLASALSRLGFDPEARTRLGVAQARGVTAIERILAARRT